MQEIKKIKPSTWLCERSTPMISLDAMHGSGTRLANTRDGSCSKSSGVPKARATWTAMYLLSLTHSGQTARIFALLNMDTSNIPFNALIMRPTQSRKLNFFVNQLCGPFCCRIYYVVLVCPTFAYNNTHFCFDEIDLRLLVIIWEQHKVEFWLRVVNMFSEGTNTLIVPNDGAVQLQKTWKVRPVSWWSSAFWLATPA